MPTLWMFYAMITLFSIQSAKATVDLFENNEVVEKVDEGTMSLPKCESGTVCGYLQANARGINKKRLCACPGTPCPMHWDEDDGFSVTQGSDQYKFCEKAPPLEPCDEAHLAYSGRMEYSHTTGVRARSERLLCICPETHDYHHVPNDNFYAPDPDTEILEWKYVCARFPECKVGDVCKTVTDNGPDFLVKKRCRCPEGLRCPTITQTVFRSYDWGNARVRDVKCHY